MCLAYSRCMFSNGIMAGTCRVGTLCRSRARLRSVRSLWFDCHQLPLTTKWRDIGTCVRWACRHLAPNHSAVACWHATCVARQRQRRNALSGASVYVGVGIRDSPYPHNIIINMSFASTNIIYRGDPPSVYRLRNAPPPVGGPSGPGRHHHPYIHPANLTLCSIHRTCLDCCSLITLLPGRSLKFFSSFQSDLCCIIDVCVFSSWIEQSLGLQLNVTFADYGKTIWSCGIHFKQHSCRLKTWNCYKAYVMKE